MITRTNKTIFFSCLIAVGGIMNMNIQAAKKSKTPVKAYQEKTINGLKIRTGMQEIPEKVTKFRSPLSDRPLKKDNYVKAKDFVPLGVYYGGLGKKTWDWGLVDLKKHNCNTHYLNGGREEASEKNTVEYIRRAARHGIKVYYQNQNSPFRFPHRKKKVSDDRKKVYEKVKNWSEKVLPRFASDNELKSGLLCWGISEEIGPKTAMDPYFIKLHNEILPSLDPYHPALVLIQAYKIKVQKELLKQCKKRFPVLVSDIYLNHRRTSLQGGINGFFRRLQMWHKLAEEHNARFWVIVASFSTFDPTPSAKLANGWRIVPPELLRMSLWGSLTEGATGFFIYLHYSTSHTTRTLITPLDWNESEEYYAMSRCYKKFARLAPLLSCWKMKKKEDVKIKIKGEKIRWNVFNYPPYKGGFLVAMNVDVRSWRKFSIHSDYPIYSLDNYQRIKGEQQLFPGEGMVYYIGESRDIKKIKKAIGTGFEYRTMRLSPKVYTGELNKDGDFIKTLCPTNISFGGKGAVPIAYYSKRHYDRAGELLDWGNGVKVPAGVYYPSKPAVKEKFLVLGINSKQLGKGEVERATLELKLMNGLKGGRIAIYPLKNSKGNTDEIFPVFPLTELEGLDYKKGDTIKIEISGMLQRYLDSSRKNYGLAVVYEAWRGTAKEIKIGKKPVIKVIMQQQIKR